MKTTKLIKRIFALPCGKYNRVELAAGIRRPEFVGSMSSVKRFCRRLQRLRGMVVDGKVFQYRRERVGAVYTLEPAWSAAKVLPSKASDPVDALNITDLAARLKQWPKFHFPSEIGRRWIEGSVGQGRGSEEAQRWVAKSPIERAAGEPVADYAKRVQPLLAPEQIGRPTREGHDLFCLEHGWDGGGTRTRRAISWELYSAVAMWVKPAEPDPELSNECSPGARSAAVEAAAFAAMKEAKAAVKKWPPFASVHEGHSVIREEFDELWSECMKREVDPAALRKEAIQMTAMGLRFIAELTEQEGGAQ